MEEIQQKTIELNKKYITLNIKSLNIDEYKQYLIDKTKLLEELKNNDVNFEYYSSDEFKKLVYGDKHIDENYNDMLECSEKYLECDFYDAIFYYEKIKNQYRCKDKEHFEYYDMFQELFYKKMEEIYPIEKEEAIPDKWDRKLYDNDI